MNRSNFDILPLLVSLLALLMVVGCSSESSPTDTGGGGGGGDDPVFSGVWYVDHEATGDSSGYNWENAIVHPSVAMDSASADDKIWVAAGYYYGLGDRSDPVVDFKPGVALYGGFEGTETDLSQRERRYQAVFDGGDTLYNVVDGADGALLHGITVQDGAAMNTNTSKGQRGGGICCWFASMRISNCYIARNEAYDGGGIYARGDSVVIDSCIIIDNHSHELASDEWTGGGGVKIDRGRAVIDWCAFSDNTSDNRGGALFIFDSSADVSGSGFDINNADFQGGGISVCNREIGELKTKIIGCSIGTNTALRGGGLDAHQANLEIIDCSISGNDAIRSGSGMILSYCWFLMEHCIVSRNGKTALFLSFNVGSTPSRIFNCLFHANGDNDVAGGAIYNNGASPVIDFCTISGNRAREGAGIYSVFSLSRPVVTNSILWNNRCMIGQPQVQDVSGATTTVTYTDIDQDGFDVAGWFNLRSDPLFAIYGMNENYYLSAVAAGQASDSPCIDAGNIFSLLNGLNTRTTRTDFVVDGGQADLGFHHKVPDWNRIPINER